ncbi:MAG TPA: hypothetical protein VFR03_05985 [Thermoanaerobaculia bacterium]|nr:hypothetical protein [Thermoanaerobaculia bacterium]
MAQLNFLLGRNTAYFHLQHPLPNLTKCVPVKDTFDCKDLTPFDCQPPFPQVINGTGGTPNQKTERIANQIAYYFFTHPDRAKAPAVYKSAERFFNAQWRNTGHQCVGSADEALTASHGPIWWRAIASLRITSWAIAQGQVPWFKDGGLEQRVLGWIQWHQELGALGEILGGPQKWKVLLPGARWSGAPTLFPDPCPGSAPDAKPGQPYPADSMTDQVSNVIYQLIKTGKVSGVPWKLGNRFWTLDPCALDRVGAVLIRSAVEHGLGFGMPQADPPKLHSQLVVDRYPGGHVAHYPCGMPNALKPSIWGWADYNTGCMSLSADGTPPPPKFSGKATRTVVDSVLPCP